MWQNSSPEQLYMIKCTRFFFLSNFIETIEELFVVQLFTGLQIYIYFCEKSVRIGTLVSKYKITYIVLAPRYT